MKNRLVESIYESVENNSITEAEANILLGEVYTEVYDAHKGKKMYFINTQKKYDELNKLVTKIKDENADITRDEKLKIIQQSSEIISSLILEAMKIPDDDFFDRIFDINYFINGLLKFWAIFKAHFTVSHLVYFKPRTKRCEVISKLRKLDSKLNKLKYKIMKDSQKSSGKKEVTKESVESLKLSIYEQHAIGNITESEKDALLTALYNK